MSDQQLKKVSIRTVGCRLNQFESEKIAAQLYPLGFERVESDQQADLYIINTCTVTHRADSSCRNYIRRAVRENPNGRVVVAGCYVDSQPETISGIEGVDLIVSNREKDDIVKILIREMPELFDANVDPGCAVSVTDFFDHNRAWLKVSDGCNQRCSYCIIPKVRGPLNNRPPQEIIDDVNSLVTAGYKEVVMTAVHLGHYRYREGDDPVKSFAALCRRILDQTDLYRLRLASIEPQTISSELVALFKEAEGRICRNFHASLQSGSARILRMMHRPYDPETYIRRVSAVKEAVPNTIIGADVIVGFPGEIDDDFQDSRRLVQSGIIDYLHVFSYSDRPGTQSSALSDKVNHEVIKERVAVLSEVSDKLRKKAHERQVGETLEVICEQNRSDDGRYMAISDNYIKVKLSDAQNYGKKVVKARVVAASDQFVEGDVINTIS